MEGQIPEEKPGENLTFVMNKLLWAKWKIALIKSDVTQIHRLGKNRVIICFNDLRAESCFRKLLDDNKWDWQPT